MTVWTLATLRTLGGPKAAIGINGKLFVLEALEPLLTEISTKEMLQSWEAFFPRLDELANRVANHNELIASGILTSDADLLTPTVYPDGLFAIGGNYSGHLKAMGMTVTKTGTMPFFIRPPRTSLVGPGDTVVIPKTTKQFDWECELAVFVGRTLKDATREEASAAVAGYAVGLDLSCRDLLKADNDFKIDLARGKAQDTLAPCGPAMMPAKFVPDVNNLRIQLFLNGEKMMDGSTSEMIYKIDEQLSTISKFMTVEAGSVLFTGSPAGSAGEHGNRWLRPGDRIHAEIENVGTLDVTLRQNR
jgi:2-keto-4-pentenoate hydratase/2-oxohepta-3-ene-1,7-dioic acid hydratase in catechol pathway